MLSFFNNIPAEMEGMQLQNYIIDTKRKLNKTTANLVIAEMVDAINFFIQHSGDVDLPEDN